MKDCIFCKIINKEISSDITYKDSKVFVLNDIEPKAPIHKLIIPVSHISTLNDLDETNEYIISHMFFVAKTLAEELKISNSGYRTVINCNSDGGQEVFHLHLHMLGGKKMSSLG